MKLESEHQEPPHTDWSSLTKTVSFFVSDHLKPETTSEEYLRRKRTRLLLSGPKSSIFRWSLCFITFGNQGLSAQSFQSVQEVFKYVSLLDKLYGDANSFGTCRQRQKNQSTKTCSLHDLCIIVLDWKWMVGCNWRYFSEGQHFVIEMTFF